LASRYIVAGGTWDGSNTAIWSATSGGAPGASVPTATDDVLLDAASGVVTVTVGAAVDCKTLICTGFTGTLAGTFGITIYGNLTAGSGMTWSNTGQVIISATAAITSNGIVISPNTAEGIRIAGGTVTLADALSTGLLFLVGGTFNANNFNVTAIRFISTTVGATRVLTMGSGTWTITGNGDAGGNWEILDATDFTLNANTSTIKFTNTGSAFGQLLFFYGGGFTYYNVWFARGTSTQSNYIFDSNTFNELKDTGTVAHALRFSQGTTQTIKTWTVSGSAGNLITVNSNGVGTHTLQKTATSPASITADYVDISFSSALDIYGGTWNATHSIDSGNNSGWIFALQAPTVTTQAVSDRTTNSATGNGTVTDIGSASVTERGIVWATTTMPTTSNNKTVADGTGLGVFTASISSLALNTTYYIRAYAINTYGTSYGNEVTLTTPLMINVSKPSSTMINISKP